MAAFPEAKVILTVRSPESWYLSVKHSIMTLVPLRKDWINRIFVRMIGEDERTELIQKATMTYVPDGMETSK